MNVKRLTGRELNFWVAKSLGLKLSPQKPPPGALHDPECGYWHPDTFHPATNWLHAGPIIAGEWFAIEDTLTQWFGTGWAEARMMQESATLWLMRAYVGSQFGDEVEDIARIPGFEDCAVPPELPTAPFNDARRSDHSGADWSLSRQLQEMCRRWPVRR